MGKIGILTFHRAVNYGAVLQAYALQQVILRKGAVCEIIDFRCRAIEENYRLIKPIQGDLLIPAVKQTLRSVITFREKRRQKKGFERFLKQKLALSEPVETNPTVLNSRYDAFITGSDQVFNPGMTGTDMSVYYLSFANKPGYSYAASFGKANIDDKLSGMAAEWLKRLRGISVREDSGVRIVQELTGHTPLVHVDPSMLLQADEWEKLEKKPAGCEEPYILVYNMLTDELLYQTAQSLGKIKKRKICFVNNKILRLKRQYPDFDYIDDASPEEFLWLVHHADYVLTSSFHGTVFSLLFHKRFLVVLPEGEPRNARLVSLLEMADAEERIFTTDVRLEQIDEEPDWPGIDVRISTCRKESFRYIDEIVKNL